MKKIAIFSLTLAVIAIILAGTVFEPEIQRVYPFFDGQVFIISMFVFLTGTAYAVVERNWFIAVFTLLAMLAVPFVKKFFVEYWPYAKHIIFSGF